MNLMLPILLLLALSTPQFDSFPAQEIFKGKPAAPKLKSERDRRFQTKILEGAQTGPNFAGHYTIVQYYTPHSSPQGAKNFFHAAQVVICRTVSV